MQFNSVEDDKFKYLLDNSVTSNVIDDQKLANNTVIRSIGKIIQESKNVDNNIAFKISFTVIFIDYGILSIAWFNNDIKEHFNYSLVSLNQNRNQRNLKVVLMMHYVTYKTKFNFKNEIMNFLTSNNYFLMYHPDCFQSTETLIIGLLSNFHPTIQRI